VIIGESLLQFSMMNLPVTNKEVEVVKTRDCTFFLAHPGSRIFMGLDGGQLSRRCQTQAQKPNHDCPVMDIHDASFEL
jgi:hypothetical protein